MRKIQEEYRENDSCNFRKFELGLWLACHTKGDIAVRLSYDNGEVILILRKCC